MDPLYSIALGLSKYMSQLRYLCYPGATRALRNSHPEAQRARCLKRFAIRIHDSGIDKVSTRIDVTLTAADSLIIMEFQQTMGFIYNLWGDSRSSPDSYDSVSSPYETDMP